MILSAERKTLKFIKPAKTSRGEYLEKEAIVLRLCVGEKVLFESEASPLVDLSIDGREDLMHILSPYLGLNYSLDSLFELKETLYQTPTLRFAVDCLIRQVKHGNRVWVENAFSKREKGISINGLVWMNDIQEMENEAFSKIEAGFDVIKIKVGALDFDEECRLLERIRKKHNAFKITLRLDANGAFDTDTALEQIKELSRFEIHSIEQPIKPGQEELELVCRQAKIPIALDEELIGFELEKANSFIQKIRPSYLILKPTLLGGLDRADSWVSVAEKNNIGWWSTSALEGNIGLYDIALWASSHQNTLPQGLGTGSLFVENFPAKTKVIKNTLFAI